MRRAKLARRLNCLANLLIGGVVAGDESFDSPPKSLLDEDVSERMPETFSLIRGCTLATATFERASSNAESPGRIVDAPLDASLT